MLSPPPEEALNALYASPLVPRTVTVKRVCLEMPEGMPEGIGVMMDKVTIPALLQMKRSRPATICREAQAPLF